MSQSICDVCVGVLEHRLNPINTDTFPRRSNNGQEAVCLPNDFAHHHSWETLRASADANCWICSRIYNLPSVTTAAERYEAIAMGYGECYTNNMCLDGFLSTIKIDPFTERGLLQMSVYHVEGEDCNEQVLWLTFYMIEVPDFREPEILPSNPDLLEWTGSSASLLTAKRWLDHCLDHHTICNVYAARKPWSPTRLIDLEGLGNPSASIRLIITDNRETLGPYATLSHCWGSNDFIKLTKEKLTKFCEGITFTDMPRTFREAVFVCRALEIRYLWIDSLCIIQDQDDLSDWTREASLMHRVYTHSHLNISASDALDGTHGLFRYRRRSAIEQMTIRATLLDIDDVLQTRRYIIEDPIYWEERVSKSKIHTRGWVFQERIMAPRVLHFIGDQLAWECQEDRACEKYPDWIPYGSLMDANYKERHTYEPFIEVAAKRGRQAEDVETCYGVWNFVVTSYSDTRLTRASDRLIAISGVARTLAVLLDDIYVVGLWRRRLEHQLLWNVFESGRVKTSRNRQFLTPTWSWASMQTRVYLNRELYDPQHLKANVENVDIKYTTEDPFGQVEAASIDLKGELRPMSIRKDNDTGRWYVTVHSEVKEQRFQNWHSDEHDEHGNPAISAETGARLFYMIFAVTETRLITLLLVLVDQEASTFERWGLIRIVHEHLNTGDLELREALLTQVDDMSKEGLPCLRYEDGKHVIRVI